MAKSPEWIEIIDPNKPTKRFATTDPFKVAKWAEVNEHGFGVKQNEHGEIMLTLISQGADPSVRPISRGYFMTQLDVRKLAFVFERSDPSKPANYYLIPKNQLERRHPGSILQPVKEIDDQYFLPPKLLYHDIPGRTHGFINKNRTTNNPGIIRSFVDLLGSPSIREVETDFFAPHILRSKIPPRTKPVDMETFLKFIAEHRFDLNYPVPQAGERLPAHTAHQHLWLLTDEVLDNHAKFTSRVTQENYPNPRKSSPTRYGIATTDPVIVARWCLVHGFAPIERYDNISHKFVISLENTDESLADGKIVNWDAFDKYFDSKSLAAMLSSNSAPQPHLELMNRSRFVGKNALINVHYSRIIPGLGY